MSSNNDSLLIKHFEQIFKLQALIVVCFQLSIKQGGVVGGTNTRQVVGTNLMPRVGPTPLVRTALTNQVVTKGKYCSPHLLIVNL